MSPSISESLQRLFRLTTVGRYQGDPDLLADYSEMLDGRDPALVSQACDGVLRRWTGTMAPPIGVVLVELAEMGRRAARSAQAPQAAERREADSAGLRDALQTGQAALRDAQGHVHGDCPCGRPADFCFSASYAGFGPAGPTCHGCVSRHLEGVREQRSRELRIAEGVFRRIRQGQGPTASEKHNLRQWGFEHELNAHLRAAGMLSNRRDEQDGRQL